MKLVQLIFILQLNSLSPALHVSTPAAETAERNVTETPEALSTDPYIHHLGARCRWTFRMPGNRSGEVIPLPVEFLDPLADQICQELKCGRVHKVKKTMSPLNRSCFSSCSYKDRRLQNCFEMVKMECYVTTEVVCGHQPLRLAGHKDRCAGRVELWKDGKWGTVCDDSWDLRDASVVCSQLGCGEALRVTGQGGLFPVGRGPVHLDELNCTGDEENLWDCPGAQEESDCGHKEDAGVVCSGSSVPAETTAGVTELTTTAPTSAPPADVPSPEHLSIMVLSLALLILFILNMVLCCLYRRRHVFFLQQTRSNQRASTDHPQNHYKEDLNLVKVSPGPLQTDVPSNSRILWTQISSVDSASVDTDYEQNDPSDDPSVRLSTFRNSQRYRTDLHPSVKLSALSGLAGEGSGPPNQDEGAANPQYSRLSKLSEDSFDSSSTSSGECYENVNPSHKPGLPVNSEPGQNQVAVSPPLYTNSVFQFGQEGEEQSSDDDGDYCPVSPD